MEKEVTGVELRQDGNQQKSNAFIDFNPSPGGKIHHWEKDAIVMLSLLTMIDGDHDQRKFTEFDQKIYWKRVRNLLQKKRTIKMK